MTDVIGHQYFNNLFTKHVIQNMSYNTMTTITPFVELIEP